MCRETLHGWSIIHANGTILLLVVYLGWLQYVLTQEKGCISPFILPLFSLIYALLVWRETKIARWGTWKPPLQVVATRWVETFVSQCLNVFSGVFFLSPPPLFLFCFLGSLVASPFCQTSIQEEHVMYEIWDHLHYSFFFPLSNNIHVNALQRGKVFTTSRLDIR